MDNTAVIEALDNPGRDITLAGKTYRFREPGLRRGREILSNIGKLLARYPEIERGMTLAQFDIVNEVLDFLYESVPGLKAHKQHIDDHAGIDEILSAFKCVAEVLQRPLSGGPPNMARQKAGE